MTIICSDPLSFPWLAPPPVAVNLRIRLADELNAEWRHLGRDPRVLAEVEGWGLPGGELRHLDEVLSRAGYLRPADDDAGDRMLARLVRLAASEALAARVVLQRLLPGLIRTAVRRAPIVRGGATAAFGELVSAAWLAICTYPIGRRPRRVAANLLRDIEYQAFVRQTRRRVREDYPGDLEMRYSELLADPTVGDGPSARFEWEELTAWALRRGVGRAELDLLVRMANGQTSREIAASMSCSDRNVRYRRAAAAERLRRAYADDAA